MRRERSETGYIAGRAYRLLYDRRGNIQACDSKYRKEWRWFAWDDQEYTGDFKLKREALASIAGDEQ